MKTDIPFYTIISLSALVIIASFLSFDLILIGFASCMIFMSVLVYKLSYIFEAIIFKRTNLIQIFDGYELSGDRNTAIRRIDENVISVAVALLDPKSKEDLDKSKIENIISHINYPFKFIMQVEKLNLNKITDKLETSRSLKEIELSRLDQSSKKNTLKVNQLQRELEYIRQEIEAIKGGDTPVKVFFYLFTSSVSRTTYDAEEKAKSQIRELSSQFDAILKSKSKILNGNELLEILKMDSEMVLT